MAATGEHITAAKQEHGIFRSVLRRVPHLNVFIACAIEWDHFLRPGNQLPFPRASNGESRTGSVKDSDSRKISSFSGEAPVIRTVSPARIGQFAGPIPSRSKIEISMAVRRI